MAVYAMRPRCLCEWWLVYQLEYGMIINLGFSLAFVYSNAICCAMPRFVHGMCIRSVNTLFLCCCPPRGNYIVHPSCHASGTSLIPRHFARHYPCTRRTSAGMSWESGRAITFPARIATKTFTTATDGKTKTWCYHCTSIYIVS